jgi:hypothetical protein
MQRLGFDVVSEVVSICRGVSADPTVSRAKPDRTSQDFSRLRASKVFDRIGIIYALTHHHDIVQAHAGARLLIPATASAWSYWAECQPAPGNQMVDHG